MSRARSEPKASEVRAPAGPGRGRAIGTIGLLAAALVLVGFLALGQYQSAQKLEVRVQALTTELSDARETRWIARIMRVLSWP